MGPKNRHQNKHMFKKIGLCAQKLLTCGSKVNTIGGTCMIVNRTFALILNNSIHTSYKNIKKNSYILDLDIANQLVVITC